MICMFKTMYFQSNVFYVFSAAGLAWQAALKKTNVRLDLLTDVDTLLMVEKGIR